jgi:NADPH:quinone reductase-like Zn-dependent oxidoreductase
MRLFMRQLQLVAYGEPSDVIELNTVAEPALGQEDVLISMEAAPLNPSDLCSFAASTASD